MRAAAVTARDAHLAELAGVSADVERAGRRRTEPDRGSPDGERRETGEQR